MNRSITILIPLVLLTCSWHAAAQRALVITKSVSVTGKSTQSQFHTLNLDAGTLLEFAHPLPGSSLAQPPLISPDRNALLLMGHTEGGRVSAGVHSYRGLLNRSGVQWHPHTDTRQLLGMAGPVHTSTHQVLYYQQRTSTTPGTLALAPWSITEGFAPATTSTHLPGHIINGIQVGLEQRALLLTQEEDTSTLHDIQLKDTVTTRTLNLHTLDLWSDELTPVTLRLSPDNKHIWLMATGFIFDRPAGRYVCRVWQITLEDLTATGPPITVSGTATTTDPALLPVNANQCWILTRETGSGFIYGVLAQVEDTTLTKQVEASMPLQDYTYTATWSPQTSTLALASGKRLELWSQDNRDTPNIPVEHTINTLQWLGQWLVLSAGNQVMRMTADGALEQNIAIPHGQVEHVQLLRGHHTDNDLDGLLAHEETAFGTDPTLADSDGDGRHDGIDTAPALAQPWLDLPWRGTLQRQTAGQEVRALWVNLQGATDASWRVEEVGEGLPGFTFSPKQGTGSGPIYYGLSSAWHTNQQGTATALRVQIEDQDAIQIPIQWQTFQTLPPTLLWLHKKSSPATTTYTMLKEHLSRPPLYLSHEHHTGPYEGDLKPYTAVLIDAGTINQGVLTTTQALQYVTQGGTLVILGQHLPDTLTYSLTEWLAPTGIFLDMNEALEGALQIADTDTRLTSLQNQPIQGGAIRGDAADTLATVNNDPAWLRLAYGSGTIHVLSDGKLLNIEQDTTQQIAIQDLFRTFMAQQYTRYDFDGDGLIDSLEDTNNNGQADAGETHFLRADTDGDGVLDAQEDRNQNGVLDPGETDPRNRDSDGDGLWDGADALPYPALGAPVITRIEPAEFPAEGGTLATIYGRNLGRDATFFLGEHRAKVVETDGLSYARILIPPNREENTTLDVQVKTLDGKQGLLAEGFRYTERTPVRIYFKQQARQAIEPDSGLLRGRIHCTLDFERDRLLRFGVLQICVTPHAGFQWDTARWPGGEVLPGVQIDDALMDDSVLQIRLTAATAPSLNQITFELPWRMDTTQTDQNTLQIGIHNLDDLPMAYIIERGGGMLKSIAEPLTLQLRHHSPTRVTAE